MKFHQKKRFSFIVKFTLRNGTEIKDGIFLVPDNDIVK
jgi:hypothetical protein